MAYSFDSVSETIEEIRNGNIVIIADDESRENEGDFIVAAELITPEHINFMACHGRGLICLALTRDTVTKLNLSFQPRRYTTEIDSAFTVSIDARHDITTGISAYDRAKTIHDAVTTEDASYIKTPGHIFPVVANQGGVKARAGHTEAAVALSQLAGLHSSGVICEIIKNDGSMARRDSLLQVAQNYNLKICSIEKIKKYIIDSE